MFHNLSVLQSKDFYFNPILCEDRRKPFSKMSQSAAVTANDLIGMIQVLQQSYEKKLKEVQNLDEKPKGVFSTFWSFFKKMIDPTANNENYWNLERKLYEEYVDRLKSVIKGLMECLSIEDKNEMDEDETIKGFQDDLGNIKKQVVKLQLQIQDGL